MLNFASPSSPPSSSKQFSFHRSPLASSNRHSHNHHHSTSSQSPITTTLLNLPHQTLIDICLDSFDQNQYLKAQHFKLLNQSISHKQQITELKSKVDKKRDNIKALVENHGKITRMFERHMKMCGGGGEMRGEEGWEKKFRELEGYMGEYVRQSGEVQEEYVRSCNRLREENERVYAEIGGVYGRVREMEMRMVGMREVEGGELQGSRLKEWNSGVGYTGNNSVVCENEMMKREIERFGEQKKMLEVDIRRLQQEMEGLRERIRILQIQNAGLKAQMYLRDNQEQGIKEVKYKNSKTTNSYYYNDSKYDYSQSQQLKPLSPLKPNTRYNINAPLPLPPRKHILIPPLKIHQSLQKIKQIQRSHSATHL